MKKIFILIAILFVLVIIALHPVQYLGWKTIRVNGVGSFMVPSDWIYTVEEGLIYFTDKPIDEHGCCIYLAEPVFSLGHVSNKMFGKAGHGKTITCKTLSNSAGYGQEEFVQDGHITTKYVIWFYSSERSLALIAWDNLVNEETVKKIAESYALED